MKAWTASLPLFAALVAVSPVIATHSRSLGRQKSVSSHVTPAPEPAKYAFHAVAKFSVSDAVALSSRSTIKNVKGAARPPTKTNKIAADLKGGVADLTASAQNGTKTTSGPKIQPEDTLCTLNVENFDLNKILRELSSMSGANMLLLSNPDQKLTLRLTGVKMIDMLRHVCALTGMRYMKIGETYVVATEDKLKKAYPAEWDEANPPGPIAPPQPEAPKPITSLYMLTNITAEKAADVLKKAFPAEKLTAVPGPQYMSPSLTAREATSATGVSGTATERSSTAGLSKALVLVGLPADVALASEILKKIDQQRPQAVIAVSITDITNDALKDLGLSWTFGDVTLIESTPNGVNFGSISRASQTMAAKLTSLIKTNAAKLLTSTSLSVLDGESAFILIGDKINYPVLVGYSQANTPIFSKETERVGIYLQLSCAISDDGTITLTLYPQVSSVTGFLEVNGASYPQISTREAQTTLRFKSGETVVMGGLMKDEDIVAVDRVPLLSKIPILGELFKHRKTTKTKSQVIITITPLILDPKSP